MANILIVHVKSTLNNTIFNITDLSGKTLTWLSSGTLGFKGSKRSSMSAAEFAANKVGSLLLSKYNCSFVHLYLNGIGLGRIASIKGLKKSGVNIDLIRDVTSVPHNGCRPSKKRRL
jgi:small subunit ribosomal protein S11